MRYRRDGDIILISRNKRHVLRKVREGEKNEDGCINCALFDVCLDYGKEKSVCERMKESGVITQSQYDNNIYFINAE